MSSKDKRPFEDILCYRTQTTKLSGPPVTEPARPECYHPGYWGNVFEIF